MAQVSRSTVGLEEKWGRQSFFDGGLLSLFFYSVIASLITVFTLGIAYPWALCLRYGWKINHTVIDGHRMQFSGTGIGLLGNWIKWLFFIIITFGIYSFWVVIKLEDWKVKHTHFIN